MKLPTEIWKSSLTSVALVAPTSMTKSSKSTFPLRFSADKKWTGWLATIPDTFSPLSFKIQTSPDTMFFGSHPPSGKKRIVPFGLIACTIKPTSSACASKRMVVLCSLSCLKCIYVLRIVSSWTSQISLTSSMANFDTSSSMPLGPKAVEKSRIRFIFEFIYISSINLLIL